MLRPYRIELVCVAVLVAVFLAIALPRYLTGLDWADEGFLTYSTVRVMAGEMPNRDFVSLQPPLSFYVLAAVFKVFGTSLASERLLGLTIFLLIAASVYGVARFFVKPVPALAAAIPATLLGEIFCYVPFAVWQGILFTLLAVWCYLFAVFRRRLLFAFVAGMFTTFSACSRHDQAFYLIISIFVLNLAFILAKDRPFSVTLLIRTLLVWMLGGGVVAAMFLVFWWSQGAFPEMWRQLVLFPFSTYRKTSSLPFPRFSSNGGLVANATALLFFLPIATGALILAAHVRQILSRGFFMREALLTFLFVWSALFYCQALTRSDINHLLITFPPFFILLVYSWQLLFEHLPWPQAYKSIISVCCWILFSSLVWEVATASLGDWRKANERLSVNRGGLWMEGAPFIDSFMRRLQAFVPPTGSILCLPYQPMYYFLSERRNPTRWNYLWPGDQTPADHMELIREASQDRPAVVLLTGEDQMAVYAPTIVEFVRREYVKTAEQGNVSLYVQRSRD